MTKDEIRKMHLRENAKAKALPYGVQNGRLLQVFGTIDGDFAVKCQRTIEITKLIKEHNIALDGFGLIAKPNDIMLLKLSIE